MSDRSADKESTVISEEKGLRPKVSTTSTEIPECKLADDSLSKEPDSPIQNPSGDKPKAESSGMETIPEAGKAVHLTVMKHYVQTPNKAFGIACGFQCVLFVLFIVLTLGVGSDFLNMNTDAALHLWKNKWKIRIDALTEGEKIASKVMLTTGDQLQQEESRIPAGEKTYTLGITYNSKDGNILTKDKLLKVKEFEDFIVNHADYSKYCLRESGTAKCKEPTSIIRACVPSNCGYVQNLADTSGDVPEGCGSRITGGSTPATDCTAVKSYLAGIFQCTNADGCTRDKWTISKDFINTKTAAYASASFGADYPETDFLTLVDTQFGSGSTSASALMSKFQFGFPLAGFTSTSDRPEEQSKLVEDFLLDAYFDKLEAFNDDDDAPFNIGYSGGGLLDASVSALMTGDFALVAAAFLVVWLYVMFMTGSIFLSTMAMAQIFLCFFGGFFVYRIIFGSFFSTFHVMAIFLLVGVGVDNVFVFLDHYEAALQANDSYLTDTWGRMSWTWKHAGVAMGVTSGTTATSFFMNATSSFPGIEAFGIFAGCLCIVLYISMMFFWPAVVALNQVKFKHRPFCCGCLQVCAKVVPMLATSPDQAPQAPEAQDNSNPSSVPSGTSEEKAIPKPALVRFFEDHFSYFILNFRLRILIVYAVLIVVMASQLGGLEAAKEEPDMLPETHPLMQYGSVLSSKFLRGGGTSTTQVKLVFGFDKEPLDREGTDNTGTGNGADSDTKGILGTVQWNPNFVDSSGNANEEVVLRGFDCFIQLCDSAEVKDSARNTGGAPAYTMAGCFPRDVKEYLQTSDPTNWEARWASITGGDMTDLKSVISVLLSDTTWATEFSEHTFAEQSDDIAHNFFRYFVADLRLTSTKKIGWEAGNDLVAAWEAWLTTEMNKGECAAVKHEFWPFLSATDFHSFKVSETLMTEMFSGVMVSIIVALVVLVIVTGNIITGTVAAITIALIVMCVMAIIPMMGWTLGMIECIALVMVPGLSVDFTAHLAESYNQAHYDNREHRVIHALEHSGISIVSGSMSTSLAALCLLNCKIVFFQRFGILLLFTIGFAVVFSLGFFPSVMCLIGPTGSQGDWHKYLSPLLQLDFEGAKVLRIKATKKLRDGRTVVVTRIRSANEAGRES
mmetsp:Transcript_56988/g.121076  ORF Transcript_56988/g.121076 Transcript_56988/m.121076 type:complete len:1127 (+) Transcript_56988:65-3445(+)